MIVTSALAALVWLGPHQPVRAGPLGWLDDATASATAAGVRLLGWTASQQGPFVWHPSGFAIEIYYRCTGLLPALFLAGAVLAYPAPLQRRWQGAAVGVPAIWFLNLLRLLALFVVGVERPALFPLAHEIVAETLIALAVLGYWLTWSRWAVRAR